MELSQVRMHAAAAKVGFGRPKTKADERPKNVTQAEAIRQQIEQRRLERQQKPASDSKGNKAKPVVELTAEQKAAKELNDAAARLREQERRSQPKPAKPVVVAAAAPAPVAPRTWKDELSELSIRLNGTLVPAVTALKAKVMPEVGKTPGQFDGKPTPDVFLTRAIALLPSIALTIGKTATGPIQQSIPGMGAVVTLSRLLSQGDGGRQKFEHIIAQLETEARELQRAKK